MITLEHIRITAGIALVACHAQSVVNWLIYGAWWQG